MMKCQVNVWKFAIEIELTMEGGVLEVVVVVVAEEEKQGSKASNSHVCAGAYFNRDIHQWDQQQNRTQT